jgi:hypothetical protein
MCPSKTKPMGRVIAAAVAAAAVGSMLGGCSDLYTDRRDTVSLSGGDAVAANRVAQMVDPWPPHSGNTNIAFNGERMQRAVECYRDDNVVPSTTSIVQNVGATSTITTATSTCTIETRQTSPSPAPPATSIGAGTTTTTSTVVTEPSGKETKSSTTTN